jgi:hypothetical protein
MTTKSTLARTWLRMLACLASVALGVTGCHMNNPYQPTDPTRASQAATSLQSLPTLEDTLTQVTSTIERAGQQISAVVPTMVFAWHRDPSRAGCSPPYEQSDGQEILLANYLANMPIPEENWKQVYDIATQAANTLGATAVTVFKDAPNDHDVQFSSETGTTFRLASEKLALLSGSTGCRLPAKH